MTGAIPVTRGCGRRTAGAIYAETGLSPFGRPIEEFIFCPPLKIEPADFGLRAIGVVIFRDKSGVYHIMDRVGMNGKAGTTGYPNAADMIEEIRRFGMSRKLNPKLDYSLLTPGRSKHFLVHDRGWIENAAEYLAAEGAQARCPKGIEHHPGKVACCAGLWYDDLREGAMPVREGGREVVRRMASFQYIGRATPEGVQPRYAPAVIAAMPITRFAVVRDRAGGHLKHADMLRKAGHRPEVVDE